VPRKFHVVMRHGRWVVVRADVEGDPASAHDRRDDAVEAARALAAKEGADVVVFGLDGKVLQSLKGAETDRERLE